MNVQLRSFSALASTCFLGLALTTATGCGALGGAAPNLAGAASGVATGAAASEDSTHAPADPTLTPAGEADPAVASKRLEVAGFQSLVDQETAALATKGLSAGDKAEHTLRLAKLQKMQAESEGELAVLEKPYLFPAKAPSLDRASAVALTSASVRGSSNPAGSALGAVSSVAAAGKDPKGAALGLAKLGASHVPGGATALGAASALAGAGSDPKGAALGLAKLGASHVPGGAAALGAASALASDPKGAAKDLAKQGAAAALSKAPIPGALKGSLFGMGGK